MVRKVPAADFTERSLRLRKTYTERSGMFDAGTFRRMQEIFLTV